MCNNTQKMKVKIYVKNLQKINLKFKIEMFFLLVCLDCYYTALQVLPAQLYGMLSPTIRHPCSDGSSTIMW